MKYYTRFLFTILVLCCVAGTTVQAEITDVYLPESGATSLTYNEIVAAMGPDTNVHVENTFGNTIRTYASTTSYVPANSYGLTVGGSSTAATLKVLTTCLNNVEQTTVLTNGTLGISSMSNTPDNFHGNLNLAGGTITVEKGTLNILHGTKFSISDGTMTIQNNLRLGYIDTSLSTKEGPSIIEQSGGRVELTNTTQTYYFRIGYKTGTSGEYYISNGTLSCYIPLYIGEQSGASGKVIQSGGYFKAKTSTVLGVYEGGQGEITITGGEYIAGVASTSGETKIGNSGTGILTINGGSFTQNYGWLNLGYEATGSGTLNIDGGTLNYTVNDFRVGRKGTGEFNLKSGTVNLGEKNLVLGYYEGAEGTLNMTGGTINCNDIIIASSGTGTATVSNGATLSSTNDIQVGGVTGTGTLNVIDNATVSSGNDFIVGNSGIGTLNVGNGGSITPTGYLYIGNEADSEGIVNVNDGGKITIQNHTMRIGQAGTGTLNIKSGGVVDSSSRDLHIGHQATGNGTLNIEAGGKMTVKATVVGTAGTGTINVNGGTLDTSGCDLYLARATDAKGYLNMYDGSVVNIQKFYLGEVGTGVANIYGGTLTANDETHLGTKVNSTGTLNIDGGTVSCTDIMVGSSGTGTLSVGNGGSLTPTGYLYIGYEAGSEGIVNVNDGGKITMPNHSIRVGQVGTGTLNIKSGGVIDSSSKDFHIGHQATGNGTLNIEQGGKMSVSNAIVGNAGTGTINLNGGSFEASADLYLARATAAKGYLNMYDGSTLSTKYFYLGEIGTGVANIYGGTLTTTSETRLGAKDNSTGTLNIDGGTANIYSLQIGYAAVSTGYFTMKSGELNITSSEINVGYSGEGYATISGGDVTLNSLRVGRESGSKGELTIEGGTMTLSSSARIGVNSGSEGYLYLKDNGIMSIAKVLSVGQSGTGTAEISGGELTAGTSIEIADNGSSMTLSGGSVTTPALVNASALTWTDGSLDTTSVTGNLNQEGGTFNLGISTINAAEIIGNYTQAKGAKLVMDIDQANGLYDTLTVTSGDLDLNGTLLLNFTDDLEPTDSYQLFYADGNMDVSGVTLEFPESYSYGNLWRLSNTGELVINTPGTGVPEPSTWALLILGFAGLMWFKRSERRENMKGDNEATTGSGITHSM